MKPEHRLIDAVISDQMSPVGLTKTAELPEFLQNQIAQYSLGGAAVGGLGSALRSIIGNPDPEVHGSALSRFLRALAMGGLAGAGVGGGAQLMGIDLPTAQSLSQEGGASAPDWQTSAGLGLLGAGGAAGLAALTRGRSRNLALGSRLSQLAKSDGGVGPSVFKRLTRGARSDPSLLDRILGRSPEVSAVRRNMGGMAGEGLTGTNQEGLMDVQRLVDQFSTPVRQNYWAENLRRPAVAGGATTGILHQLLGRE